MHLNLRLQICKINATGKLLVSNVTFARPFSSTDISNQNKTCRYRGANSLVWIFFLLVKPFCKLVGKQALCQLFYRNVKNSGTLKIRRYNNCKENVGTECLTIAKQFFSPMES